MILFVLNEVGIKNWTLKKLEQGFEWLKDKGVTF